MTGGIESRNKGRSVSPGALSGGLNDQEKLATKVGRKPCPSRATVGRAREASKPTRGQAAEDFGKEGSGSGG